MRLSGTWYVRTFSEQDVATIRDYDTIVVCPRFPARIQACLKYTQRSDSLLAGRSWDQIPVGARHFALVQTGPGDFPASCTMRIGSFPEIMGKACGVNHPPQCDAEVKERVELYKYCSSWPAWRYRANWTKLTSKTWCTLSDNKNFSRHPTYLKANLSPRILAYTRFGIFYQTVSYLIILNLCYHCNSICHYLTF
jgi:hypothetical protein